MSTELFSTLPYKVADITLADFGRKEIDLAEKEMPGLMAHAGSCCCCDSCCRCTGICMEGRDSCRLLVVHVAGIEL